MVGESGPRPDRSLLCIAEDPASLDVLMPYGFEVRAVGSIQEALRVLYTDSPEIVLVDTATPHYRLLLDDQARMVHPCLSRSARAATARRQLLSEPGPPRVQSTWTCAGSLSPMTTRISPRPAAARPQWPRRVLWVEW